MAAPGGSRVAWRASQCRHFPAAHGSTAHADPRCPCSRAPAALLNKKNTEGRRRRETLGSLPPPQTSPGHGKTPAPCQASESPLVLRCRGGHLLHALGWHNLALSQGKVPCASVQSPHLESLIFRAKIFIFGAPTCLFLPTAMCFPVPLHHSPQLPKERT